MSDEPQTRDTMIAALLREREGLVQRGLPDRVKQVDEQLKIRGYKKPAGGAKQQAPAETQPPQGRQQQPPATT
ncbi:hypothetical protein ACFXGT_11625 [Streptomyces sp. NPDC059352]|uniref:hypothetical protein n=1 Tax=Streptomyces sp. NPDC059352 TaxID=3346810 RepID=UPI0036CCFE80